MVVHYPRTVWKNSYPEHEVTGKTYKKRRKKKLLIPPWLTSSFSLLMRAISARDWLSWASRSRRRDWVDRSWNITHAKLVTVVQQIIKTGYPLKLQGPTNRVSGRPGQPEKSSGQPGLGVWLPSGQPRFSKKNKSEIFITHLQCFRKKFSVHITIQIYTLQNVLVPLTIPGQPLFRFGQLSVTLWLPGGQPHLKSICHALKLYFQLPCVFPVWPQIFHNLWVLHTQNWLRGDVKIHNSWLQPTCCSIQQLCIAFPIELGCSWLLNMGAAASEFWRLPLADLSSFWKNGFFCCNYGNILYF